MTSNDYTNHISAFPPSFVWGAASSAYQTEGYSTCDGYHRYEEDIALASQMGMKAYRFSISWSRVDPLGDGSWNMNGLAYYKKLVDCCISYGIEPYVTLHHWELPQALEDQGGWLNELTARAFERYASFISSQFKDKVHFFITLNEPQCVIMLGYGQGIHAPGKHLDMDGQFTCLKNMLIAHSLAYQAIKENNPEIQVGIASTGH